MLNQDPNPGLPKPKAHALSNSQYLLSDKASSFCKAAPVVRQGKLPATHLVIQKHMGGCPVPSSGMMRKPKPQGWTQSPPSGVGSHPPHWLSPLHAGVPQWCGQWRNIQTNLRSVFPSWRWVWSSKDLFQLPFWWTAFLQVHASYYLPPPQCQEQLRVRFHSLSIR